MANISTRKNKNGTIAYVVRAYICRDAKGNPRYVSKTYVPEPGSSERKVKKHLQELSAELDRRAKNSLSRDSSQRFEEYAQHFLERKKLSCENYTLHS